jgi:hypothetical protein
MFWLGTDAAFDIAHKAARVVREIVQVMMELQCWWFVTCHSIMLYVCMSPVQALFYHPLSSQMDPSEVAGEAGPPTGVVLRYTAESPSSHPKL